MIFRILDGDRKSVDLSGGACSEYDFSVIAPVSFFHDRFYFLDQFENDRAPSGIVMSTEHARLRGPLPCVELTGKIITKPKVFRTSPDNLRSIRFPKLAIGIRDLIFFKRGDCTRK